MTKDMRVKAMGQVIQACAKGDDKTVADAVKKIVAELLEAEKAHRAASAAEQAERLATKQT